MRDRTWLGQHFTNFSTPTKKEKKRIVWESAELNKISYADGFSWWMGFCAVFY